MAKNNDLINRYKVLYEKVQQIVPEVYAGLALALYREHGWTYEQINDLFAESQAIWQECVDMDINMVQMCEEETGIDVQRKVDERG